MKNNKGFSLVELIVVIAIMAILVGVAVPVYSSYVEKARMASDRQLVEEVEHALKIYYQSGAASVSDGYIILSLDPDDMKATAELNTFMEATFGEGWKQDLTLSYDGWNTNQVYGLWNLVGQYQNGEEGKVLGSSFLNEKITTESMMGALGDLLGIAAGSIANDKAATLNRLNTLFGIDNEALKDLAQDDGVTEEDFNVAVSNVLVGFYADKLNDAYTAGNGAVDQDPMVNLMYTYANAYAYSEITGDKTYFKAVQDAIINAEAGNLITNDNGDPVQGLEALNKLGSTSQDWETLLAPTLGNQVGDILDAVDANAAQNNEALKIMMGAVGQVAGSHNSAEDLLNGDLYEDGSVAKQIDAYKNALKIKDALDTLPQMGANDVIILLLDDGTVFTSIDE